MSIAAGYLPGVAANLTERYLFRDRAHVTKWLRDRGSLPQDQIILRSAYRAHLATCEKIIERERRRHVSTRAPVINRYEEGLCAVSESLFAQIRDLGGARWRDYLPTGGTNEQSWERFKRALTDLEQDDSSNALDLAMIADAVADITRRAGNKQLPGDLKSRLEDPKKGYLATLRHFMADEISTADKAFFQLFCAQELVGTRVEIAALRKDWVEDLRSTFDIVLREDLNRMAKSLVLVSDKLSDLVNDAPELVLDQLISTTVRIDQPGSFLALTFHERGTEFIGRRSELAELDGFLSRDELFLWWQVAGKGGQGKSRLALHLVDQKKDRWHAGFLRSNDLEEVNWANVRVDRPTLCVIDYVSSPQKSIALGKAIAALKRRANDEGQQLEKIRLLVLDRVDYDFGSDRSKVSAEWFVRLMNKSSDAAAAQETVYRKEGPLTLNDLSEKEMLDVAISWRKKSGLSPMNRQQEQKLLNALSGRAWRPLFAMTIAQTIDTTEEGSTDLSDLLGRVLSEERSTYWLDADGQTVQPREQAENIAFVANIVGSIRVDATCLDEDHLKVFSSSNEHEILDILSEAWMIVGQRALDPEMNVPISGREPDLLGEYQVLSGFEKATKTGPASASAKRRLAQVMDAAWKESQDSVIEFLIRLSSDFKGHASCLALLNHKPKGFTANLITLDQTLLIASGHGLTGLVRLLISQDRNAGGVTDQETGGFPLLLAAQEGHAEAVEALIQGGADPKHVNQGQGVFPLYLAAKEGHAEAVEALIEGGADPKQLNQELNESATKLAKQLGHKKVVGLLLEAAATNAADQRG